MKNSDIQKAHVWRGRGAWPHSKRSLCTPNSCQQHTTTFTFAYIYAYSSLAEFKSCGIYSQKHPKLDFNVSANSSVVRTGHEAITTWRRKSSGSSSWQPGAEAARPWSTPQLHRSGRPHRQPGQCLHSRSGSLASQVSTLVRTAYTGICSVTVHTKTSTCLEFIYKYTAKYKYTCVPTR